jgi:hypothetical protein
MGITNNTAKDFQYFQDNQCLCNVYGDPSEELQKILTTFGVQLYKPFAGFSR